MSTSEAFFESNLPLEMLFSIPVIGITGRRPAAQPQGYSSQPTPVVGFFELPLACHANRL